MDIAGIFKQFFPLVKTGMPRVACIYPLKKKFIAAPHESGFFVTVYKHPGDGPLCARLCLPVPWKGRFRL